MSSEGPVKFRDIAPALEFIFWVVVILLPFLRFANGPAVTDDQFLFQCLLAAIALTGATSLRIFNWKNQ